MTQEKIQDFFNFRIGTNVLKCRNVLFLYWFHVKLLFYFLYVLITYQPNYCKKAYDGRGGIFNLLMFCS